MGERDVSGFLQMCDAPSDAYSAGEWCEAAGALAARLAAVETERDEHIAIELKLSDALNARDAELKDVRAERDEARHALVAISDDALALLDQHVSPEVHKETRLRLIERIAALPVAARPETGA